MLIHPIGPEAWRAWRSVRLRALRESPDSFSSSYAEASGPKDNETYWRGYFTARGQNYLASFDGETVGQVRVVAPVDSGGAGLKSLWVASEARSHGVGTALIEACWNWLQATTPGQPLRLSVQRHNRTARRLYERLGFASADNETDDASEHVVLIKQHAR